MRRDQWEGSLTVDLCLSAPGSQEKYRLENRFEVSDAPLTVDLRSSARGSQEEEEEEEEEYYNEESEEEFIEEGSTRLNHYISTCISELKYPHTASNLFSNLLYLISSALIIGDHMFSIQNRVQEPVQSDEVLPSLSGPLWIFTRRRVPKMWHRPSRSHSLIKCLSPRCNVTNWKLDLWNSF